MSIAIVYGSTGGNTENVAQIIAKELGKKADLLDIANVDAKKLNKYDSLILGTSTWYDGELQDDWDSFDFAPLDLEGKNVALFGLGDIDGYGHEFCDALGTLYDICIEKGANIVGDNWSTEGYDFEYSNAVRNDAFVGLALDEENQSDQTEDRVQRWIKNISSL